MMMRRPTDSNMNLDGPVNPVIANTARSTPTMSPRSPLVPDDTPAPLPTADPRRIMKKTGSTVIQPHAETNTITTPDLNTTSDSSYPPLGNVVLLCSRKIILEQREHEKQDQLRSAKQERENRLKSTSQYPHVTDYIATKIAHLQDDLRKLNVEKAQVQANIHMAVGKMDSDMRTAIRDILPDDISLKESPPRKEEDQKMLERISALEKQVTESTSENTDVAKLEETYKAQISAIKSSFEAELSAFKQSMADKFHVQELVLSEHRAFLDDHKLSLAKQQTSTEALKASVVESSKLIGSMSQRIGDSSSGKESSLDGLAEVQAEVKDQKFKLANLPNHFASKRDLKDLAADAKLIKDSIAALKQESSTLTVVDDLKDMSARLSALENKLNTSAENSTAADLAQVHESLRTFQVRVDELTKASPLSPISVITGDEQQVSAELLRKVEELEKEIEKLKSVRVQYGEFYSNTEETQKKQDTEISQLKLAHNSFKEATERADTQVNARLNGSESRLGKLEQELKAPQNALTHTQFKDKLNSVLPTEIQKHSQRIVNAAFTASSSLVQEQVQSVKREMDVLKHEKDRDHHTLRALDARYNAISTQEAYKHVIAWIEPKVATFRQLATDREQFAERLSRLEQGAGQSEDQLQKHTAMEELQAQMQARMVELEKALKKSSAPTERLTNGQPQTVGDVEARIKSLEAQLNQLRTAKETSENSRQVCEELQQNVDMAYGTMREENATLQQRLDALDTQIELQREVVQTLQLDRVTSALPRPGPLLNNGTVPPAETDVQNGAQVLNVMLDDVDIVGKSGYPNDKRGGGKDFLRPAPPARLASTTNPVPTTESEVADIDEDDETEEAPEVWIVIGNVASKVSEVKLKQKLTDRQKLGKLPQFKLRSVWFRGQKGEKSEKSNRRAVLQLNSHDPGAIVAGLNSDEIEKKMPADKRGREVRANEWSGRTIEANQITIEEARAIINEPVPDVVIATPSRRMQRDSVFSTTTTNSTRETPSSVVLPASVRTGTPASPIIVARAISTSVDRAIEEGEDTLEVQSSDDPLSGWNPHTGSGSQRVKKKTQIGSKTGLMSAAETPTSKRKRTDDAYRGGKRAKPN